MLLNRRGWSNFLACGECGRDVGLPVVRRDARAAPGRGADVVPPLRPRGGRAAPLPRLRVGLGGSPWRRHRAARGGAHRARLAPAGVPAGHRHRGLRRRGGHARALRPRRVGGARGHPDGGQGPRLPRRDARRGAGRRRHAAVPRLPGRGAHVRTGCPAGRAQRPRRARGQGDRAGARPVGPRAGLRRPPRQRGLPRGGAGPPRNAQLPTARAPDPGGLLLARSPGPRAIAAEAIKAAIQVPGVSVLGPGAAVSAPGPRQGAAGDPRAR